jgi:hypothetical protein
MDDNIGRKIRTGFLPTDAFHHVENAVYIALGALLRMNETKLEIVHGRSARERGTF